mgnify:CR=1 FL=1
MLVAIASCIKLAANTSPLEDGDREAFVLALSNVAEAQGQSRTATHNATRVHKENLAETRQVKTKQSDGLSVETLKTWAEVRTKG